MAIAYLSLITVPHSTTTIRYERNDLDGQQKIKFTGQKNLLASTTTGSISMVVVFTSSFNCPEVVPVPKPMTNAFFASGLIKCGRYAKRKFILMS